jgi:hypothetical protein
MKPTNTLLCITILFLCALGDPGYAQTKVSLRDQSSSIDFTNALYTRPVKTGTVLPGQCTVGDLFFRSNATPGQNLFACVAANTWNPLSGSSSLPGTSGNSGRVLSVSGDTAIWTALDGDVTGTPGASRVTKLQNRAVANIAPATGMALVWNGTTSAWEPQNISGGGGGGGGSLAIQNDGVSVGSRSTLNWTPGLGLTNMLADTGTTVQIQQNVDTSVIQSRANTQSGQTLYCPSNGNNGTSYTCGLSPVLTAYTTGMVVYWRPDVNAIAGPVTLNIDTLGARPVRRSDGTTDPPAGDVVAGQLYALWYDGAVFRLPTASSSTGGGTTVQKDGPYLQIASAYFLMPGMYQATKPNTFTWADASSGGTWTTLDGGALSLQAPAGGGGVWRIRQVSRGTANTVTYAVQCLAHGDGDGTGRCALFLRESSSGRMMMVEFTRQALSSATTVQSGCWTNATTYSGVGLFNGTASALSNNHIYARFQFTGGNVVFQVSQSGLTGTWMQMGSWSQTACGMSAAPDQAGIAAMAANGTVSGNTVATLLSFRTE